MSAILKPAAEFDYSPRVRELFVDLQHAGALRLASTPNPEQVVFCADAGSQEQGATIRLCMEVRDAVVHAVRYQAYGCPHFLAACESLARWLEGRLLQEGRIWSRDKLELELEFPVQKRAKLLILEDALTGLLAAAAKPVT